MGRVVEFMARRSALALAVSACLVLLWIKISGFHEYGAFGNDFSVYWRTANTPLVEAYALHARPFPYMPTMLLWIGPLAHFPALGSFLVWAALSALAFVWACRKHLDKGETLLALVGSAVVFSLLTGQVSVMSAAIMLWAFGADDRVKAGVALAIVASIKPQIVLMAPLLLLFRRDFKAFLSAGFALAAILAATLLTYGIQPWIDWFNSLPHFRQVLIDTGILRANASPAGFAERTGQNPIPYLIGGAAFGAWLVYRCRNMGPVETTALVGVASICAAPYALTYDLAVAAPYMAMLVMRGKISGALGLTALLHPMPIILASFNLLRDHAGRDQMVAVRDRADDPVGPVVLGGDYVRGNAAVGTLNPLSEA